MERACHFRVFWSLHLEIKASMLVSGSAPKSAYSGCAYGALITKLEERSIESTYLDCLECPDKYLNISTPGSQRGVNRYWVTRNIFDKSGKRPHTFSVVLEPGVLDSEPKEFITFVGKAILLANELREDSIPLDYVEVLSHFNFKQKDGMDDRRTFYLTPLIIKGSDIGDHIVSLGKSVVSSGEEEFKDVRELNVYSPEGAQMSDFLLKVWFELKDNNYAILA